MNRLLIGEALIVIGIISIVGFLVGGIDKASIYENKKLNIKYLLVFIGSILLIIVGAEMTFT